MTSKVKKVTPAAPSMRKRLADVRHPWRDLVEHEDGRGAGQQQQVDGGRTVGPQPTGGHDHAP